MAYSNYWNEQRHSATYNIDTQFQPTARSAAHAGAGVRERLDFCQAISKAIDKAKSSQQRTVTGDPVNSKVTVQQMPGNVVKQRQSPANHKMGYENRSCATYRHVADKPFESGVKSPNKTKTEQQRGDGLAAMPPAEFLAHKSPLSGAVPERSQKSVAVHSFDGLLDKIETIIGAKTAGGVASLLVADHYVFVLQNERFTRLKIHLLRMGASDWRLRIEGNDVLPGDVKLLQKNLNKNINKQQVFVDEVDAV